MVSCNSKLTDKQFAQELLSTFSTTIGEVALIPATGGIFTVELVGVTSDTGYRVVIDCRSRHTMLKEMHLPTLNLGICMTKVRT
jgi:hypothetical protein